MEQLTGRYSVVLIDDEELILQSLQGIVSWNELRCCVEGTAKDGAEGITLIERLRPNIVITDVKMPGKSGLDVADYCNEHFPETRVIVISAYDDFAYVQKAMFSKAVNYLLKPIDRDHLIETVGKTIRELDRMIQKRLQTEKTLENAKTLATSSLLFNLARYGTAGSRDADEDWIREQMQQDSVVVMAAFYNLKLEMTPTLAIAQSYIERSLQLAGYRPIFGSADDHIIFLCPIMPGTDKETARQKLAEAIRVFLRHRTTELGEQAVFCISPVYSNEEQLQQCYGICREMVQRSFFCSESLVLAECKKAEADIPNLEISELVYAVMHGDTEKTDRILESWKREIVRTEDQQFALAKIREISREVTRCAAKLGMETTNRWEHQYTNENFDARYACVMKGVQAVSSYAKQKGDVVSCMCLYVQQQYADRELNLEKVADTMKLNSNYLSRLFKKEKGENFSDYLTDVRMEKARELLSGTQMKTYRIAEEVGYGDPHYFSQVFKKRYGMVPAEYRRKTAAEFSL